MQQRRSESQDDHPAVRRYLGLLAYAIAGESKAYGFTLIIWATAMATVGRHGFPDEVRILLFVFGALTGFLVAIAVAFPNPLSRYHRSEEPERYAYGQFHLISILLSILAG